MFTLSRERSLGVLGDCMKRRNFVYALFVVIVVAILALLPLFVGKIDSIYLFIVLIAIGFLWTILRVYMRKTYSESRNEV